MADSTLFKSVRAKFTRAKENVEGLQMEIQRFSDSKPYELRHEVDVETGDAILVYYPVGGVPDDWIVIVGEICHNLRSALDHAVYELTIRETGTPLEKTEFPIFNDKNAFIQTKKDGVTPAPGSGIYKIRGLSQKTRDSIEAMQPYNLLPGKSIHPLWVLHEMNIIDKHRALLLCRRLVTSLVNLRTLPGTFRKIKGGEVPSSNWNLDERTVIARFQIEGGAIEGEVYMETEIAISIFFDEGGVSVFDRDYEVILVLNMLLGEVEAIIHDIVKTLT